MRSDLCVLVGIASVLIAFSACGIVKPGQAISTTASCPISDFKGSCTAIDTTGSCIDYIGSDYSATELQATQCSGKGVFSSSPCSSSNRILQCSLYSDTNDGKAALYMSYYSPQYNPSQKETLCPYNNPPNGHAFICH